MTTNLATLSLVDLFGKGATQDENTLVIQKASLITLIPLVTNTADSLLAGILITALNNFKGIIVDENNQSITDESGQSISFDNSESFELPKIIDWKPFFFNRLEQRFVNHQIIVEAYTTYASN